MSRSLLIPALVAAATFGILRALPQAESADAPVSESIPTSDPDASPWEPPNAFDVDRWRVYGCDTDTDCERLSRFMLSICPDDAMEDSAACALFDDFYVRPENLHADFAAGGDL
jgi:hypothetical protein